MSSIISSSSCLLLKISTDENVQILTYFIAPRLFSVFGDKAGEIFLPSLYHSLNIEECADLLFAQFLKCSLLWFFQACKMPNFFMQFFHICIVLIQSNSHKIIINRQSAYQLMQRDFKQIQELCFVMVCSNAHYKLSVLSAA